MTEHQLKSWPEFFQPVADGFKTFELRLNDRNFKVGDTLVLCEYDPALGGGTYSGRQVRFRVTYVMNGLGHVGVIAPYKGLNRGYCIMGIKKLKW